MLETKLMWKQLKTIFRSYGWLLTSHLKLSKEIRKAAQREPVTLQNASLACVFDIAFRSGISVARTHTKRVR